MSFFGLGGGGIKLHIALSPPPEDTDEIVKLDHPQRWKAHKNPFHSLKLGGPRKTAQVGSSTAAQQQQQGPVSYPYADYDGHGRQQYGMAPHGHGQQHDDTAIYAYGADVNVEGTITLMIPPGKKAEHLGMKVEFIGRIDTDNVSFDGRPHYDFISLSKELEAPCTIYDHRRTYPFYFKNIEKQHDTYHGKHVSVRYFVRVALERKFLPPLTQEREIIVQKTVTLAQLPPDEPIKMEVGIEDCLHIEFEYEKRHYHLEDVIKGKVNFLLVRIKIKHMELALIRRETVGTGSSSGGGPGTIDGGTAANAMSETQVLIKYEVMDGAPVKDEVVPVRMFLKGVPADLTPTYSAGSNNRFSVRYFLNLVLVDEEDRRYFKQSEVILHRINLG